MSTCFWKITPTSPEHVTWIQNLKMAFLHRFRRFRYTPPFHSDAAKWSQH